MNKLFIVLSLVFAANAAAIEKPRPVSVIQVLANPSAFDGKIIKIGGYLIMGERPDFFGQQPLLYLHEEDAKNLLTNFVWVEPSEAMKANREKLDRVYVLITARFRADQINDGDLFQTGTLVEVQDCKFWSNPKRPIGDQQNSKPRYK
jgi:hypothetical protein